jgi:hypothetical protein
MLVAATLTLAGCAAQTATTLPPGATVPLTCEQLKAEDIKVEDEEKLMFTGAALTAAESPTHRAHDEP